MKIGFMLGFQHIKLESIIRSTNKRHPCVTLNPAGSGVFLGEIAHARGSNDELLLHRRDHSRFVGIEPRFAGKWWF